MSNETVELRSDWVALSVLVLYVAVYTLSRGGIPTPIIRPALAFILLTFVPGTLGWQIVGYRLNSHTKWLLYVLGLSLMLDLGLVVITNIWLPVFGISQPLAPDVLVVSVAGMVVLLSVINYLIGGQPVTVSFELSAGSALSVDKTPLALLTIPLLGVIATFYTGTTGEQLPLILVLGLIAVIPLGVVLRAVPRRWYPLALFTSALMLLYGSSIGSAFGGQSYVVTAWQLQHWAPAEYALVPNGALFPMYALMGGINILTEVKIVNPVLVAFIPVVIYKTFNEYVAPETAVLAAFAFNFAHPFHRLYPTAGRVATPVLFLSLLALTISDKTTSLHLRRMLTLLFALGVVVSHYGTTYFVLFAVISALGGLMIYRTIDVVLSLIGWNRGEDNILAESESLWRGEPDVAASGSQTETTQSSSQPLTDTNSQPSTDTGGLRESVSKIIRPRTAILSWSFIIFYGVMTLGWYIFTQQGKKYGSIVKHVEEAFVSLFSASTRGAATANRLQANYGAQSIALAKRIYILLAVLMGIGILFVFVRRFFTSKNVRIDDEYITFSTAFVGVFALSFVIDGAWGGGRPMMIVFSVSLIFAVIGVSGLVGLVTRFIDEVPGSIAGTDIRFDPKRVSHGLFAILLVTLFVLNSGIAAATVLGGTAPSGYVSGDLEGTDNPQSVGSPTDMNIETHTWMAVHRNESRTIYADQITRAQAQDWLKSEIVVRIGFSESTYKVALSNDLQTLKSPGIEKGYVILTGHNTLTNASAVGRAGEKPITSLWPELNQRQKVYTSGKNVIFFAE